MAHDGFEASYERRHQESRNSAVHVSCDPAVKTFAESVIDVGIDDRVKQPGKHFARVGQDIAIVKGDDVRFTPSKNVSIGHPGSSALALFS